MKRVIHKFDIDLPLPPSMNTYWRRKGNIYFVSSKGVKYRKALQQLIQLPRPFKDQLAVHITYFRPDERRRDLDNLLKPLLDACTHAGLWADDVQVRDLRITDSGSKVQGGAITLHVESYLTEYERLAGMLDLSPPQKVQGNRPVPRYVPRTYRTPVPQFLPSSQGKVEKLRRMSPVRNTETSRPLPRRHAV